MKTVFLVFALLFGLAGMYYWLGGDISHAALFISLSALNYALSK